jgi:integrase
VTHIGKLKALTVARIKQPGMYGDGGGLWLQVTNAGARSWIFRFWIQDRDTATGKSIRNEVGKVHGRSREMGLGSAFVVSLEEARELASEHRKLRRQGIDPLEVRRSQQAQHRLDAAKTITFEQCAEAYIKAHRAGWRNAKHAQQWQSTLVTYAGPVLGSLSVQSIDASIVLKVIEPIWTSRPETASRVRGRIERILDWAKVRGYRDGENPARWRGHLAHLLPARSKVRQVIHHAALNYTEAPAFMATLRAYEETAARALEFTILTAARSGETIGAKWSEIDLVAKTWTVPAARMKAHREHRVPLSNRAIELLRNLPRDTTNDFVFTRPHGPGLTHSAMRLLLRRIGHADIAVHGFRSSFSDWAAEQTAYPSHVVEQALAHTINNAVERAYRRGDLFDKRRRLMEDWARFCNTPASVSDVIPLRRSE